MALGRTKTGSSGTSGSAVAPDRTPDATGDPVEITSADLSRIFHKLNNQLGVILANAELLESRLSDEPQRARAGQVVTGALEAISAIQDLRRIVGLTGPLAR
jgi:hypothetical protein